MTFIYTLTDPFTNEIRYVGKSNDPKKRFYDHIKTCYSTNTHKNNWVKSILQNGGKPILKIIDKVPKDNWQFWEIYWIAKLKSEGSNLTNIDVGGNGITEHNYNTIEKMKIRHKEFPNYNKCSDKEIIIDKDSLYKKYIIENLSLNKCSDFFKTSKCTIHRNLVENNIKKDKSIWINQCASHEKKIILQYDLKGNFINEYIGLDDAKKFSKACNISNCCLGKIKSSGGYIWRYKDGFIDLKIEKIGSKKRKINQYDLSGNFINSFNSISEASNILKINNGNIQTCCKGKVKSAGGFIWRYIEDKAPTKYLNKTLRGVIQYDMNMNFINEYNSLIDAEKSTGFRSNCIQMCCKGTYKHSGGFIWRYKFE